MPGTSWPLLRHPSRGRCRAHRARLPRGRHSIAFPVQIPAFVVILHPNGTIDIARETEITRWVNSDSSRTGDDVWQTGDELLVPLSDAEDGQLLGFLSVDDPESGLRPQGLRTWRFWKSSPTRQWPLFAIPRYSRRHDGWPTGSPDRPAQSPDGSRVDRGRILGSGRRR